MTARVTQGGRTGDSRPTRTWDKLEKVFEDRVERALTRLGVPTNKDIQRSRSASRN